MRLGGRRRAQRQVLGLSSGVGGTGQGLSGWSLSWDGEVMGDGPWRGTWRKEAVLLLLFLFGDGVLAMLLRLALNSWAQVILLPQPP